jgi:hypothetical protein
MQAFGREIDKPVVSVLSRTAARAFGYFAIFSDCAQEQARY